MKLLVKELYLCWNFGVKHDTTVNLFGVILRRKTDLDSDRGSMEWDLLKFGWHFG